MEEENNLILYIMISPLAYVDPAAKLGKNVTVQPFAYIEADVEIWDDNVIMSGARILNGTRMGKGYIMVLYLLPSRRIFTMKEKKAC